MPFKNIHDKRYERVIKQSLNRRFNNKLALNKSIAKLIAAFSHSTVLEKGDYMICRSLEFFVVNKILSNHWVSGFFCPSELQFNGNLFYYLPKFWNRSAYMKKKVFAPFSHKPFVKVRKKTFYLQRKLHEPMSSLSQILQSLNEPN